MTLRNRIVMSPMVTNYAALNGEVTERLIAYHAARAAGGCGLNIVEATYMDMTGNSYARGVGASDDAMIPGLRRLADAVHEKGGRIALQLQHGGRVAVESRSNSPRLLVSFIPGLTPVEGTRVMVREDMDAMVKAYGEAAARAVKAGFDAVEIHGAHGYLIAQFLSRATNHRTDEYGGSLENRARFACEVIRSVRRAVGNDFPVLFRLSSAEFIEDGIDVEEACRFACMFADAGIDMLHVNAGMPETGFYIVPTGSIADGWNAERAGAIRKALNGRIPVAVAGKIMDPALAENILREGKADLIVMGRALIADPELPRKAMEGRTGEIRPCLACNEGCIGELIKARPISCAVNPTTGCESLYPDTPAASPRRLAVVGAGPAGMMAALTAARRGHDVTLFDEHDKVGGLLHAAVLPPHKQSFHKLIRYFAENLPAAGVRLELGKTVTAQELADGGFDMVFVAAGSEPAVPAFCRGKGVRTAQEVLQGAAVGRKVLILGGGLVGSETAEFLAEQGKEVCLVELRDALAVDMEVRSRALLLKRIARMNIRALLQTECLEVEKGRVKVRNRWGAEYWLEDFDDVVAALGYRSRTALSAALSLGDVPFRVLGDCAHVGKVMEAIHSGFRAAYDL